MSNARSDQSGGRSRRSRRHQQSCSVLQSAESGAMAEHARGDLGGASRALAAEEEIIQWLRNLQQLAQDQAGGGGGDDDSAAALLYEDADFPAETSSLYLDPSKLPDYALGGKDSGPESAGDVAWHRPTEYTEEPAYFTSAEGCGVLREGALQDAWLLGVLAAVALHPDNLIENLFVSESLQAFRDFGVFTCRFYKDDVWVPVTTDTRVPYSIALAFEDRCSSPGAMAGFSPPGAPLYGSSADKNEVFIPFLEKAYAKLHGSYQVLDERHGGGPGGGAGTSSGRILEAFLDCTGGSAHRVDLQLERSRQQQYEAFMNADERASPAAQLWRQLLRYQRKKCILTTQLRQLSFNAHDVTALGLVKNRQYVLLYATEVALPASGDSGAGGSGAGADANSEVLRLVKIKTVWGRGMWKGEWSNDDSKWEEHTQVEQTLRSDPLAGFSRAGQDGCFWMRWEDLLDNFSELFVVHVFASGGESHQYSAKGEWLGVSAAGAPAKPTHDDHSHSPSHGQGHEAGAVVRRKETAIAKTRWAWLTDAEPNWHRNPQFKLSVPLGGGGEKPVGGVLLSLTQRDFRLHGGDNYALNMVLLREKLSLATAASRDPPPALWELKKTHIVAEAHSSDTSGSGSTNTSETSTPLPATPSTATSNGNGGNSSQLKALPERELVKEDVTLAPGAAYYLVPYTTSAKVEMEFFLRVVAPRPLRVERVPAVLSVVRSGRWRADDGSAGAENPTTAPPGGGELANAGGPLLLLPLPAANTTGQENAAWCQNPQFWVRFAARSPRERRRLRRLLAARPHVTLKAVLRKTSHRSSLAAKTRHQRDAARDRAHLVGLTAVRARPASVSTPAPTTAPQRTHVKPQRTNFLGEPVASPYAQATAISQGLQRREEEDEEDEEDATGLDTQATSTAGFPVPKLVVDPTEWCRLSSYSSPAAACLFLRKLPKDWLMDTGGLLLVPTLGEAGAEGSFELQVDCDFPLLVDELPRGSGAVQSVPGEWTATSAGGCHLHADWRQNPRFFLHLQGVRPAKVRITLSRSEREWKSRCQRDAVGSMIGFYLFRASGGKLMRPADVASNANSNTGANGSDGERRETPPPPVMVNGRPWSETDFVPLHAVSSPPDLVLPAAAKGGYVILPATYEPGHLGRFVLSVQCDTEFSLTGDAE